MEGDLVSADILLLSMNELYAFAKVNTDDSDADNFDSGDSYDDDKRLSVLIKGFRSNRSLPDLD
jgi:hypothetical protein